MDIHDNLQINLPSCYQPLVLPHQTPFNVLTLVQVCLERVRY